MTTYWIGIASRDHVRWGVAGGFCQLGHGKQTPVRRLKQGDIVIYYLPRERLGEGKPVQAFTAAGCVLDEVPYQPDGIDGFKPYRRNVAFFAVEDAPIRPMLDKLSFTAGHDNWGYAFRRGTFKISVEDFAIIAEAMGLADTEL